MPGPPVFSRWQHKLSILLLLLLLLLNSSACSKYYGVWHVVLKDLDWTPVNGVCNYASRDACIRKLTPCYWSSNLVRSYSNITSILSCFYATALNYCELWYCCKISYELESTIRVRQLQPCEHYMMFWVTVKNIRLIRTKLVNVLMRLLRKWLCGIICFDN